MGYSAVYVHINNLSCYFFRTAHQCCTEQTAGSGGQITMRCKELNEEEDNGEGDNGEDAQFS